MSTRGLFVVSLDFELYWGMFDKVTLEEYGANIRGAHAAIPEILALFKRYGIHATWAIVGMLMCEDRDTLSSLLPKKELRPVYGDMRISSYAHMESAQLGVDERDDPYHFGASLVRAIAATPGQELASHTFSHYYCLDGEENTPAVFAEDCAAQEAAARHYGAQMTSIVFPRNQTTREALRVCAENGYTAYRGTPAHVLYSGKKEAAQVNPLLRMLRLIDAYINITGHHTFPLAAVREGVLANVLGSRFLRPYTPRLRFLEPLRLLRIKAGMTRAAKKGEVFHLWWHPHNFGINRKENLAFLTALLEHFAYLNEAYGMESASMREVATRANGSSL
jgi:hypothetical protein